MLERLDWPVVAGAVVLLAIVMAVVLILRSPRRQPVKVVVPPDDENGGSGYTPLSETEAGTHPALGSEDEAAEVVKIAWEKLMKLLVGDRPNNPLQPLNVGGRFHHRSGVQFTVVHATPPWCVIVRWKKGSKTVTRVLVNKNEPLVLCAEEPFERREMEDGRFTTRILAEQAHVATCEQGEPMSAFDILDLAVELPNTVYLGGI